MFDYNFLKIKGGSFDVKACHFINNDSDEDGFDICNDEAEVVCDNICTFTSDIVTKNNTSILNKDGGTYNGSGDPVFKI